MCSVDEIDPGILGIIYSVLVPKVPFLYLRNQKSTKQTRKYQENSLKDEGTALNSEVLTFFVVSNTGGENVGSNRVRS